MADITISQAAHIADEILKGAAGTVAPPLTVAIVDSGGRLLAIRKHEAGACRASAANFNQIESPAAFAAHALTEIANGWSSVPDDGSRIYHDGVEPIPRGLLVRSLDGHIAGAVGIEGAAADALRGHAELAVKAAGLTIDQIGVAGAMDAKARLC